MAIGIYSLISPVHDVKRVEEDTRGFLDTIEKNLKEDFVKCQIDTLSNYPLSLIFVASGGVEGQFKQNYKKLKEPYYLLTNGENNSFAASLEILTFLKQQGLKGEILHGSVDYISSRIRDINSIIKAKEKLRGINVGIIGKPSDWLIASHVDYEDLNKRFKINAIEIDIEELLEEINRVDVNKLDTLDDNKKIMDLYKESFNNNSLREALRIYIALKNIVEKYYLAGLTIRCFDLLSTVHNTGCIALSLLNDEGIISSCEGDVPALISMLILNALSDEPVFMANPSSIDIEKNEVILAHCTVPLDMTKDYVLDTHFESGIGVGIHGEIQEGQATLFKLNSNLEEYFVSSISIKENMYHNNLCRTQIRVHMDEDVNYFLTNPMGNHHLICRGDYARLVDEFMNSILK